MSARTALSIAGSDPSGGAGIQADLKSFAARGAFGMAVLTALTAQNTQGVTAVHPVPPDFVAAQIAALRADIRIDAVKIGMIANAEVAEAVAEALAGLDAPLVLDPVMMAKGGHALLPPRAVATLRSGLLPLADLLTPNLPEAAALLGGGTVAQDPETMLAQARALLGHGPKAVLLKGGHLETGDSSDLLVTETETHWLPGPRIETGNTHGTGCSLSSAIAAELALGQPLRAAAERAKAWLSGAIAGADALNIGQGHGPVDHFHHFAPRP